MSLMFYPHEDDVRKGSLLEKLDILLEAAERYKAIVLDSALNPVTTEEEVGKKRAVPRDQSAAFNWDEMARVLRELRNMPETSRADKITKATYLTKLAEIYEVLRAAKMSKLEAVRLALINEASQLRGGAAQVA